MISLITYFSIEQYKNKKNEEIALVKKTYDDEIKKLKDQPKNPMTKGMIKNIKKERDEAVDRVKDKFKQQRDEFLQNLKTEYGIEE